MENQTHTELCKILSGFPHVYSFLNNSFVKKQCEGGLKNYLLVRLNNRQSVDRTLKRLPTLENRLIKLASSCNSNATTGYHKLACRLQDACEWDQYQEFLTQIDITLWFKQKDLLKEIEPDLPHRKGSGDILLTFQQQDIYCECTSFQSIFKSLQAKSRSNDDKIQRKLAKLTKGQPWMSKEVVEQ
jgi:hypothetical protein